MKAVIAVIAGSYRQYMDYVQDMIYVSGKWQEGEDILTRESFKYIKDTRDTCGVLFSQVVMIGTYWKVRDYHDLLYLCKEREKRWKAL